MISDALQCEIAAALCGADCGCCLLGIEGVNKERWRVWLSPQGSPVVLLFLATLRSNCEGRAFDLQFCLNIAHWRPLEGSSAGVLDRLEQLVSEFEGPIPGRGQRRRREIPAAALSFCDPTDRLWVVGGRGKAGDTSLPGRARLVWQHGDGLFLAIGWNSVLRPALLATRC